MTKRAYSLRRDLDRAGWWIELPGVGPIAHASRREEWGWESWCKFGLETVATGRTRHEVARSAVNHYLIEHR